MSIIVHHLPTDAGLRWTLHAWQGTTEWNIDGTPNGTVLDYKLPETVDARKVRFMYYSTDPDTNKVEWESDNFIRIVRTDSPREVWTFGFTGRVLYAEPSPAGAGFKPGDTLTFSVITLNRFKGGSLYIWNPYDRNRPDSYVPETSRDDAAHVSTFSVNLASWMTGGFHFKLVREYEGGGKSWEPDSSNRVWRPGDGDSLWCKSGQVSVRKQPLGLEQASVEVLIPANLAAPSLSLYDPVEDIEMRYQGVLASVERYSGSALFSVAKYTVTIYPYAAYILSVSDVTESSSIGRAFPADPNDPEVVSRFALGVDGWLPAFPSVTRTATLVLQPLPSSSRLSGGVSLQAALGSGPDYQTIPLSKSPDGTWKGTFDAAQGIKTSVRLAVSNGSEVKPYDWIDTSRFFIPPGAAVTVMTTEGVYGLAAKGATAFADPQVTRRELMEAAFGKAVVAAGVFGPEEMPHGATRLGGDVYFIIHAPHAVTAALVLVDEKAGGGPKRRNVPMTLTSDARYWWGKVSAAEAAPGTRYRFALNDTTEVMDPAARAVLDRPKWETSPADDPADPDTSWSIVLDVDAVRTHAGRKAWQTMGWEALLIYELHAKRFTDLNAGGLTPLQLIADELRPISRSGKAGYLHELPVTALELLPVNEFKSDASWGYNPACYFAVDSSYGGADALAEMVNTAHESGRAVLLDLVYNHSNDSPLMKIARDVYRNGDAYGDRMNCGHPMVLEFLRQATICLWRTFGLDGFRLDDTKTIVAQCQDGWRFMAEIRTSLHKAATAEGRSWPYCVAENDPKVWDMTNPVFGVVDGEWAIDQVYRIRDSSYATWKQDEDNAGALKRELDNPCYSNRRFFVATRYGESHDMVSGQDPANKRIAARPPYRQGLQMAKALGTITLLGNGVPMLFMGQETGETRYFSFDNNGPVMNLQGYDLPPSAATDNTRVLAWFRSLMGLRNDCSKGLRGDSNYQCVCTGRRTVAFCCGCSAQLFAVVTFGTPDQRQDSSWLGLPGEGQYKEIFNSSWPVFQVEFEQERGNGGYDTRISSGRILNLPWIGAVILERC